MWPGIQITGFRYLLLAFSAQQYWHVKAFHQKLQRPKEDWWSMEKNNKKEHKRVTYAEDIVITQASEVTLVDMFSNFTNSI